MSGHGGTRAKVLQTAASLFSRQGFHGTGITQLLEEAGAPKGSLYFHFPGGKQQLAVEAVGAGANELGDIIDAILEHSPDPAGAISTMAELLATRLEQSEFLDGCPVASVALDGGIDHPEIRAACRAGYDRWLGSISGYLIRSGMNSEAASDLSVLTLATFEGALLLARTRHDATAVRRVAVRLAKLVAQETQ